MEPFDCMLAVRTPEASQGTRHSAPQDSAFPVAGLGRLLPPRSISGLTLRSLSFPPAISRGRFVGSVTRLPARLCRGPLSHEIRFHALSRCRSRRNRRARIDLCYRKVYEGLHNLRSQKRTEARCRNASVFSVTFWEFRARRWQWLESSETTQRIDNPGPVKPFHDLHSKLR